MTTTRTSEPDATIVLQCQPARIVNGQLEGTHTGMYEIICRHCGDTPGRDYHDIPPRLQRIRGPYPLMTGITQYEAHIEWHKAGRSGRSQIPGADACAPAATATATPPQPPGPAGGAHPGTRSRGHNT